jgi:hypothetical protein
VDEARAGALADLFYDAVIGIFDVVDASSFSLPGGAPTVIDRIQSGAVGGSVHTVGRIEADNTGWISYAYSNYSNDGDATLNGERVVEVLPSANPEEQLARISFYGLAVSWSRGEGSYEGVISRRVTFSPTLQRTESITGSLLISANTLPTDFFAENIDLKRVTPSGSQSYELSGNARLYHDTYGWLDWSLEKPWAARAKEFPSFGGPAVGTDELGRELRIVSLTDDIVSLQFAAASAGLLDRTARVTWPLRFAAQIHSPDASSPIAGEPQADAGASRDLYTHQTAQLDAAFSSHPSSVFLRHHWRIVYRPPDSAALLDNETAFNPKITLDQPGRYLFEDEVSDGIHTARDWVAITADDNFPGDPPPRSQLVPGQTARVGDVVSIDRSHYEMTSLASGASSLPVEVIAPDDGTVLTTSDDLSTTFTPSGKGVYQILMKHSNRLVDEEPIAVESRVPFLPMASFLVPVTPEDIVAADIDGDGTDDFVLSMDIQDTGKQIQVVYNKPAPEVSGRLTLAGGGGEIAAADLSSDGRVDIAAATPSGGLDIYTQAPDGNFALSQTLLAPCAFVAIGEDQLQIADLNGDGRKDVLKKGCGTTLEYSLQTAQGFVSELQSLDPGLVFNWFETGDLNSDSIADVVVYNTVPVDSAGHSIGVLYGGTNGFKLPVDLLPYTEPNEMPAWPVIGDLDGDGRSDLAFSTSRVTSAGEELRIYSQTQSGQLVERPPTSSAGAVKGGDLDGDGRLDLLGRSSNPKGFYVLYQQPGGVFDQISRAALFPWRAIPTPAEVIGDFNGDGALDIGFRARLGFPKTWPSVAIFFGKPRAPTPFE